MLRYLVLGVPAGLGAWFIMGDMGGYSRTVDRSPAAVAMGLADLDLSEQPGSPGTDASLSGGVKSIVQRETQDGAVIWRVMSGNEIAMTMIAQLTPVDGGKRTEVTARVERGSAPDDLVAPAFRSEGVTLGLFSMALEDELNELTQKMMVNAGDCRALLERFEQSNLASADMQGRSGVSGAMGDTAKTVMKMHAYQAEARRMGCGEYFGDGGFTGETREKPEGWDDPATESDDDWGV